MLNKLCAALREENMILPGDCVTCAVSGGADSIALLFGMYLLKDKLGIILGAAHFNHHLRGEESDRDEDFVRRFCAGVEAGAVKAQMEADRAVFELDPTLDEPTHAEAARMYLGLRAYLQSGGLSGYTLHYGECGEDGRFTQLPLLAASNLLADGYGYAAEGDSTAAVLVAAMQTLCGAAGFTEIGRAHV